MNGNLIGAIGVGIGLLGFGAVYNQAVAWARKAGWMEPYTALWVAVGVGATIAGMTVMDLLVNLNAGLIALICFAASGSPMILGDAARFVRSQQREVENLRNDKI